MALATDAIDLLIRLKQEGYFDDRPSVIEIGAQQLSNSFLSARRALEEVGRQFGALRACPIPEPERTHIVHGELEHLAESAPAARDFWRWLGFDYAAIDIDGSPDSIPLDLNYDSAPNDARGRFSLVTNFGTTEHVANQLNAFEIIHDLAACGGVMSHSLPMQGMLNHGLVNYNPKFFWMLARSNGYRVAYMNVVAEASYYELPENIADAVLPFEPNIDMRRQSYRVADMYLIVVLQKVFDTPFVAPIDIPTGTHTDNEALQQRYWSVFKPNAFEGLMPAGRSGSARAGKE